MEQASKKRKTPPTSSEMLLEEGASGGGGLSRIVDFMWNFNVPIQISNKRPTRFFIDYDRLRIKDCLRIFLMWINLPD